MSEHDHDHGHRHGHDHGHSDVPSDLALRVKALESLLVEKGLVDPAALDILIDTYETKVGPRNGARVVAKAWTDPAYREWPGCHTCSPAAQGCWLGSGGWSPRGLCSGPVFCCCRCLGYSLLLTQMYEGHLQTFHKHTRNI